MSKKQDESILSKFRSAVQNIKIKRWHKSSIIKQLRKKYLPISTAISNSLSLPPIARISCESGGGEIIALSKSM